MIHIALKLHENVPKNLPTFKIAGFRSLVLFPKNQFLPSLRYCKNARGGCAPSLLWRHNKCFQWSPIDGTEAEVPCRRWEVTMRFVCEMKNF